MQSPRPPGKDRSVQVWDLPVRLFHWMLVALVATSWITAEIGGNAMTIHEWSGFTVLTLVLFRVTWGFFGSGYARFASFVRAPSKALAYARALARGPAPFFPGHNPLGGWMVLVLLASLLVQTSTGLFANDDIMTEGPLARHVSKATSDLLSKVHEINFNVLLVLLALHIAAALYYLLVKRDNLIVPMITGRKQVPADFEQQAPAGGERRWLAALLLGLSATAVWLLVR
jgi:cytochrome b